MEENNFVSTDNAQLVRVKTMADGTIRAELAFSESVRLSHFDGLLNTIVTVLIAPQGDMEKISQDISDHIRPQ